MRALVLSGGGARIHYHVGAVCWLLGHRRVQYDLFAGVSAGAIVAAYLAQFPTGSEEEAAKTLLSVISRVHAIYEPWPVFGALEGLWQSSFFRSKPLRRVLQADLSESAIRKSGKLLRISAVDLRSGDVVVFTEQSSGLVSAVEGSAAFPGMLEPVPRGRQLLVDGGVRQQTPIGAAIEAGADEIDVVLTVPETPEALSTRERPSALRVMYRAADLMADQVMASDVKIAQLTNRLVLANESKKRFVVLNIIRPAQALPLSTFDFKSTGAPTQALGMQDARRVRPEVK
jgi:NTE family protein